MQRTTIVVVCALALTLCVGSAWAVTTPPADTLKVDYFNNANTAGAPDGTVRITNPGTSGTGLCAAIYVFDPYEELSECCSCYVSPDGLRTLSVDTDLTSNPLTGVTLTGGVVKLVSTYAPPSHVCPLPTSLSPTAAIRAWATHIQNGNVITETASQDATFSTWEQGSLQTECRAIHVDGSGKGVCTCGTGD